MQNRVSLCVLQGNGPPPFRNLHLQIAAFRKFQNQGVVIPDPAGNRPALLNALGTVDVPFTHRSVFRFGGKCQTVGLNMRFGHVSCINGAVFPLPRLAQAQAETVGALRDLHAVLADSACEAEDGIVQLEHPLFFPNVKGGVVPPLVFRDPVLEQRIKIRKGGLLLLTGIRRRRKQKNQQKYRRQAKHDSSAGAPPLFSHLFFRSSTHLNLLNPFFCYELRLIP